MMLRPALAALLLVLCGKLFAAMPPAVLDLALEPAVINTNPGPEYSDRQRDYAMVIGMDRTPNGRIWAAWVAGGDSDKGYFVAASSDDDGVAWSEPRLVIRPPDAPTGLRRRVLVGNFWCDPTGRMWLFYDQSMGYFDGRAGVWAITCDNPDADKPLWSAPRRIWHGATLNKPVVLRNGEWLLPVSLWTRDRIHPAELRDGFHELDDQRMAHVFVSSDKGATWSRRGGVVIPQSDFDEHMLVELKDGRLWMLARTKQGISEAFSPDGGRTWSEPTSSAIRNPSARFFLRRLVSGNLLLVKNGPIDQRVGRSQLTAFVSDDEGRTWKGGLVLDERNGVSYPDGFQSPDGVIHIIHDRERAKEREILMARFREEDVMAAKFVQAGSRSKMLVSKALGPRIGDVIYNGIQLPGDWPPKVGLSRRPLAAPPYLSAPPKVIPIDVGRQLFVDDFLIDQTTMRRTHHLPEYHAGNPVLKPEHPWELDHAAPFSDGVWFDPGDRLFKMWYWARGNWEGKTVASTCLATSRDGVHWEKPLFDVVPGTNIVLPDEPDQTRNSATAWLDHDEKDSARRFKIFRVIHVPGKDGWRIRMSVSSDGIHWSTADESDRVGDRTTVFYNALRKVWVASIRAGGSEGARARNYHEGRDAVAALHWEAADGKRSDLPWVCADELDPGRGDLNLLRVPERPFDLTPSQLYNLDCVAYEGVLLGLFSIWRGQQLKPLPKINEICVGYSRDGFHWSRPDRRAFCPVAANEDVWNSGNLQSAGGCCLVVGDKLHFYVGAVPKGSRFPDPGNVGLATLRRDGFASMDAGDQSGTLTTRSIAFNGTHLFVNVDCPQGEMRVEVLDETGKVVPPLAKENCEAIVADKTMHAVRWKGALDLSAVAGKPVKFRFHLENGKLYAFWVSPDESGASHGYVGAGGPGFPGNVDTVGTGAPFSKP